MGAIVDLVGGQHHGFGAFAQHLGHVFVHGRETFAGVNEEEDDVGLVDGEGHLFAYLHLELVVAPHNVATSVDD